MDDKLRRCAENGDVGALYSILAQDPDALEFLDQMQFVDTPLHIAASAGNTRFAMEIATLKPSFARKLNHFGLSPMHLALQNGHDLVVIGMLRKVDKELVRVKGKESITPLHYVAQTGNVDMLAYFLRVCPLSIEDLTAELETAVHVAVKYRRLNAVKVLLGWLRRFDKECILEWQDENGNTALHIATCTSQPQVMKLLIGNVHVNNKNIVNNMTAMDIFDLHRDSLDREVGSILVRAKAKKASELAGTSRADYLSRDLSFSEKILVKRLGFGGQNKPSTDVSSIVLVVAVLIATAAYQAAISPPGGYWQDADPSTNMTNRSNTTHGIPHLAGKMILKENFVFFLINSIAFLTSECTILLVIADLPFSWVLYISTYFLYWSYAASLLLTLPAGVASYILSYSVFALGAATIVIAIAAHTEHKKRRRWLSDQVQTLYYP